MRLTPLAAILAAVALPAAALADTPRIDQREANQQARIAHGVQSGHLTAPEAAHLEKGQARVRAVVAKDRASGPLTRAERAQVTRMQNRQSHKIYLKKHNARNTSPAT